MANSAKDPTAHRTIEALAEQTRKLLAELGSTAKVTPAWEELEIVL